MTTSEIHPLSIHPLRPDGTRAHMQVVDPSFLNEWAVIRTDLLNGNTDVVNELIDYYKKQRQDMEASRFGIQNGWTDQHGEYASFDDTGQVEAILSTLKTVRGQYKDRKKQGDAYLETLDYNYINRHAGKMNMQVSTAMDGAITEAVEGASDLFTLKAGLIIDKALGGIVSKKLVSKTDKFVKYVFDKTFKSRGKKPQASQVKIAPETVSKLNVTDDIPSKVVIDSKGMFPTVNSDDLIRTHSIRGGSSTKRVKKYSIKIKTDGIESIDPIEIVVVNGKNYIVDGHHRFLAAKRLGIKNIPIKKVEAIEASGYKDIQDILDSAEDVAGMPDRINKYSKYKRTP